MASVLSNLVRELMSPKGEEAIRFELGLVRSSKSGLFFGAVYRRLEKPDGEAHMAVEKVAVKGFVTARAAAKALNNDHPSLTPLDLSTLPDESEPDYPSVKPGQHLTLVIPKQPEHEDDVPTVMSGQEEVMTAGQLQLLIEDDVVQELSSSGDDLALSCIYQEYVVKSVN